MKFCIEADLIHIALFSVNNHIFRRYTCVYNRHSHRAIRLRQFFFNHFYAFARRQAFSPVTSASQLLVFDQTNCIIRDVGTPPIGLAVALSEDVIYAIGAGVSAVAPGCFCHKAHQKNSFYFYPL